MTSNEMKVASEIYFAVEYHDGSLHEVNTGPIYDRKKIDRIATALSTHGEARYREGLLRGASIVPSRSAKPEGRPSWGEGWYQVAWDDAVKALHQAIELEAKGKRGVE